ncbi:MAG: cell wall hydrolase, partial [Clostridia bacterium]|nr:cell wall hydrolase [Clostridia bacterium]
IKIGEVMTKDHLVTAPVGTTLAQAQEILHRHRIEKLPLVDELGMEYVIDKPDFTVSESELIRAATVIQLEVMGDGSELYMFDDVQEKYWEMLAVAQCIRNRVDSKHFSPDTVDGIILQPGQFSPAEVLDAYTPTEEALTAAREALVNGVKVVPDNYYYFCATSIEARFERDNDYSLTKKADGTYDKMQGHLTTFYAGFSN